ncbi:MAG: diacylglycerol kinase family protein [Candidatus Moranbacteria bacterium]|nr:diacylglycerol kinase family protein [Candidatus Moranbacteria bacterium]
MRTFIGSLRHAVRGVRYAFFRERNFQIELALAVLAVALSFALPLSSAERAAIFLVIALVLPMELLNTACERVMDMLKPGLHPYAKAVKDLSAGAVLIASLLAALVGAAIFLPHIADLLFGQ